MKVSIIIPAYNLEDYIDKCLQAVCVQTMPASDMQIIVVDDGSTDQTPQILDEWSRKNPMIEVIHTPNQGVSAARNTGMTRAKGEFIFFFDGDDFMEPETCQEIYDIAVTQNVDTVIYGYYRYEAGQVYETCHPHFDKTIYTADEILDKVVPQFVGLSYGKINAWLRGGERALYVENPALWRIMVKRQIITENQLQFDTRLKVGEDTVFISEYLSCAARCYVEQKCYYYLVTRQTSAIYVYERKAMQKLQGKMKLLDGRTDLTARIKQRTGKDITESWGGIVVMSAVQAGFLMAAKNPDYKWIERYRAYKKYVTDPRVEAIVERYKMVNAGGVKRIPFILLKKKCYGLLYIAICILNMMHYEFSRN